MRLRRKNTKTTFQKQSVSKRFRGAAVLVFALLFGIGGLYLLRPSQAATPMPNNALGFHPHGQHNVTDLTNMTSYVGRDIEVAVVFVGQLDWGTITNIDPLLNAWKPWMDGNANRKLALSLSMSPDNKPTDWRARGANGEYNQYFRTVAQKFVSRGWGDRNIIRLGWEFDGSWANSYVGSTQTDYNNWKTYWRQIVTSMRGVAGYGGLFDFNPTSGGITKSNVDLYYPGNDVVDIIGVDTYDWWPYLGSKCTQTYSFSQRWAFIQNELNIHRNFAIAKGKPISFPEWGLWYQFSDTRCGGGDDTQYIDAMANWFRDSHARSDVNVAYQAYFNEPDGNKKLENLKITDAPNAMLRYRARFGASGDAVGGGPTTPVSSPDLIVSALSATPASPVPGQPVTFSATIKNQGTGATPATIHGLAFSVNGNKVTWSDTHNTAIATGASITLTANGGVLGSTWTPSVAGSITVSATIDDRLTITESNETNNALTKTVTVAPAPAIKVGDLNNDNIVNIFDLSKLLIKFNQLGTTNEGDLNGDGRIDVADLSILMTKWGS